VKTGWPHHDRAGVTITEMNHFTVLARDLSETRTFYVEVLGLAEGPRPPLGFPGAWLYAGGRAVLHVVGGRQLPTDARGVLDHMAFSASGLAEIALRLRAANVRYDLRRQPESGIWQLFFFDPNGARVELDFDPSEAPPSADEASS
jgi:catechol 2,3-dioxygenase-like lactoylglutathione lyase family enzyme